MANLREPYVYPYLIDLSAIPVEPASPVFTGSAALAFRKP
jgi:hypothetical protein